MALTTDFEAQGIGRLTVPELKALAKKLNIKGLSKLNKKQMVDKIVYNYKNQSRLVVNGSADPHSHSHSHAQTKSQSQSRPGTLSFCSGGVLPRKYAIIKPNVTYKLVDNSGGVYLHSETGLLFNASFVAVSVLSPSTSSVYPLTKDDIETAKCMRVRYTIPENLNAVGHQQSDALSVLDEDVYIHRMLALIDAGDDDDEEEEEEDEVEVEVEVADEETN